VTRGDVAAGDLLTMAREAAMIRDREAREAARDALYNRALDAHSDALWRAILMCLLDVERLHASRSIVNPGSRWASAVLLADAVEILADREGEAPGDLPAVPRQPAFARHQEPAP